MNHAAIYCKTLDALDRAEAVNALHQALMQLTAAQKGTDRLNAENRSALQLDHRPAIAEITRLLAKAGHIGFDAASAATNAPTEGKHAGFQGDAGPTHAAGFVPQSGSIAAPARPFVVARRLLGIE